MLNLLVAATLYEDFANLLKEAWKMVLEDSDLALIDNIVEEEE